ncbi:glutamyl-tRNA(Gln) amidotransferase subunit C, mitochondrial-like [Mesoplodon densirostris]|uniref:glutamyl-tRNA(Gln) amidotransferase subunit C, mitochondrial-like n=1 Tax=Mesoplodon densirostris TaxID=48708 RepID=UPI0028DC4871|nr:glutamyl-tRNA(Gln) amidotransferase subunit C, mitochondrial-like [Mesoplodon densirostris]
MCQRFISKESPQGSGQVIVEVMEHLQHLALMDLGSQEAYGTTGESYCLCGPAPPWITDRVEPMVSVLEDRCLYLGFNNVVECTEELLQISTSSYGGVFCAFLPIPTLHPESNISLPKMDEHEPISPGLVAVLGRGTLFTSGTHEQVKQVKAQG